MRTLTPTSRLNKSIRQEDFPLICECVVPTKYELSTKEYALFDSAWFLAVRSHSVDIVRVLLRTQKVNINQRAFESGFTALLVACVYNDADCVKLLLEEGQLREGGIDTDVVCEDGYTALYAACRWGNVAIAEMLINIGHAHVDLQNASNEETPLYRACKQGFIDIVRLLLTQGHANPNLRVKNGTTPLYIACERGDIEMVKLLLFWHADPQQASSYDGRTPIQVAEANGSSEICRLLLASCAKPRFSNPNELTTLNVDASDLTEGVKTTNLQIHGGISSENDEASAPPEKRRKLH